MGYIHNVQGKDHAVTDKDGQHFVIDAITRQITNNTGKVVLTKLDHNSECFTFEIPGEIEGHDMSDCNVVEVHYINIDSSTRAQNADVYMVEDFVVNEKKGTFSWIVSRSATRYVGTLNFAVHFACYPETEEGVDKSSTPLYSWRTGVFSGITIIDSVFSAEQAISDYSDILQSWWNKIASTHEDVYAITEEGAFINLTDTVEDLTGRVGTLETDVVGLKTAGTTMAGKVETLETEVSGLKTAGTTMAGKVETLETDVAGLKTAGTTMAGKVGTLETDVAGLKTVTTTPATPTKDGMMSAEDKIKVDWLISNSYNDAIKIANNANADAFIEVDQDGESLTLQAYNQINLKSLNDHINFITNEEEGYSVKINGEKIAAQEYVDEKVGSLSDVVTELRILPEPTVTISETDDGDTNETTTYLTATIKNNASFEVKYHAYFIVQEAGDQSHIFESGSLSGDDSVDVEFLSSTWSVTLISAKVYVEREGFRSPVVTKTEVQ